MSAFSDRFGGDFWNECSVISIDGVMQAWIDEVRNEEPWCSMPPDDRTGELRRVLEEILDPYGGACCSARLRRIHTVGGRHGAFRGAQRSSQAVVLFDFALLGSALRETLMLHGVAEAVSRSVLVALTPDWRVARSAAAAAHATERGCASAGDP